MAFLRALSREERWRESRESPSSVQYGASSVLPVEPGGLACLQAHRYRSEVMRFISDGVPWPDDRIQEFVERQIICLRESGYCLWRLLEPETGQMIGFCGLQPLAGTPDIEIGWWLARSHWGCGLATEAARVVLRDGFARVGLDRIVAVAQPANSASRRVMQKLGMRYERDTRHKGIDVVLYAIHPSPGTRGGLSA